MSGSDSDGCGSRADAGASRPGPMHLSHSRNSNARAARGRSYGVLDDDRDYRRRRASSSESDGDSNADDDRDHRRGRRAESQKRARASPPRRTDSQPQGGRNGAGRGGAAGPSGGRAAQGQRFNGERLSWLLAAGAAGCWLLASGSATAFAANAATWCRAHRRAFCSPDHAGVLRAERLPQQHGRAGNGNRPPGDDVDALDAAGNRRSPHALPRRCPRHSPARPRCSRRSADTNAYAGPAWRSLPLPTCIVPWWQGAMLAERRSTVCRVAMRS